MELSWRYVYIFHIYISEPLRSRLETFGKFGCSSVFTYDLEKTFALG